MADTETKPTSSAPAGEEAKPETVIPTNVSDVFESFDDMGLKEVRTRDAATGCLWKIFFVAKKPSLRPHNPLLATICPCCRNYW